MAKIAIDPGHGMNTPGKRTPKPVARYGRVVKEYEANKLYATEAKKALERQGHTIIWTGGDNDPSLASRCQKANSKGADIFISFHWNAGGGTGTETYHYPGSSKGKKLAQKIHPHVVKGMGFRDRGIKTANFYVLKHTRMPAILIEFGFMDAPSQYNDQYYMLDKAKAQKVAEEIAKGVQAYFGKSYKAPSGGSSGGGSKEKSPFDQFKPEELPVAPNGAKFTRTLKLKSPMMQGKDVEAVQSHAYVKKYLKGKVDGIFGPDTKQAIEKYQKEHGIKVTGEIGDWNWNYLFKKEEKKENKKKEKFHRVFVNGKQVASFKEEANIVNKVLDEVKKALDSDASKLEIRIERVMV